MLQRFGVVLRSSATIWGRFAAFCINLGSFGGVLREFGVVLLRSQASGPSCRPLPQHQPCPRAFHCGPELLHEFWGRFAQVCNDLGVAERRKNDPKSLRCDSVGCPSSPPAFCGRSATLWRRFAPFCNDLGSFLLRSALIWVRQMRILKDPQLRILNN